MRITSQSFVDRATAQTRSPKVKLSSFNGNTLVQDDIDLISVNYEDPHDTFIGSLSSRYIEVEVGEEALNVESLNAEKFKIWIRFEGSPTEMLVGEFRIDFESSVYDEVKRIYSLIMFDDAFFLDQQVIEFAYSSLTMGQVVEEVCSIVGVSLDIDSLNVLPFASKSAELWNISFDENMSYREIINDFSKVNLALPYFNSLGFLSFATPFTNAAVAEVSGFDYTSLNFDKKAKPINAVVFEVEEGVDDPIFKRNEASIALHGLNELKIVGSRFMSLWPRSEVQSVVNQWYNIIHARNPEGFFYYPFNTDQVMRPDLEAADNVKIIDRDGTEYPSILSSVSWTWVNGGLKGRLECPQLPETLTDYVLGGPDRDMLEMGVKVNRLKKEITIGISDVKKQIKEIETTPGKSAYEIAIENGFTGTEQEWLDSLHGEDGENGIPGKPGADGKTSYFHTAWANSSDGTLGFSTTVSIGKNYMGTYTDFIKADSQTPSTYKWTLIKGEKGDKGDQGLQGIPGQKGADGKTTYTWLKYADTPTSGMSDLPAGKKYMGIAVNKTTATESTNYADYTWSKVEGDQGIPGTPGADGKPTYTWVKYADTPTTGMSDDPTDKKYIGLAFNKTTQTESTNYGDYQWSLMPQNITVGGRNLLSDTEKFCIAATDTGSASDNYRYVAKTLLVDLTESTHRKVILSGKTSSENEDDDGKFSAYFRTFGHGAIKNNTVQADKDGNFVTELQFNDAGILGEVLLYSAISGSTRGRQRCFYNVKLEVGDVATDWTPAPEDVDAEIKRVETETTAKIKITEDAIDLEKSKRTTELYGTGAVDADGNPTSGLIGTVRTNSSNIKLLDDEVRQEVKRRLDNVDGEGLPDGSKGFIEEMNSRVDTVESSTQTFSKQIQDINGELSEMETYYRYSATGMELGSTEWPTNVYLNGEDGLVFDADGGAVAQFGPDGLYANKWLTDLHVMETFQQGNVRGTVFRDRKKSDV